MKKIALALSLLGSLALASNLPGFAVPAFLAMLTGSVIWVTVFARKEREAAILNASFAVINVIGIINHL